MGNGNSMINITFDREQPAIYYAGETITGRVQFTVPERTGKIEEVYLSLSGDVGFTTARTARMQNGQIERITDQHNIRIYHEKIFLGHATTTEQGTVRSNMNDMTVFEPGQYKYPFTAHLPNILPPTIHPTDYPFVRYELQLVVEKKWYCSNTRHQYPLRIYPRVNLLQILNAQSAIKFDRKHKDLTVKGTLQRSGLIPGEQTNLSVEIHNPSRLEIKEVDICLIQRYEIEDCRRRSELFRMPIPQLSKVNREHIETTSSITLPLGIPPSYTYKSDNPHASVFVEVHYDLKLEVKVKGFFLDFDLQVPVIVGTHSTINSSSATRSTKLASSLNINTIDISEIPVDDHGHRSSTLARK